MPIIGGVKPAVFFATFSAGISVMCLITALQKPTCVIASIAPIYKGFENLSGAQL